MFTVNFVWLYIGNASCLCLRLLQFIAYRNNNNIRSHGNDLALSFQVNDRSPLSFGYHAHSLSLIRFNFLNANFVIWFSCENKEKKKNTLHHGKNVCSQRIGFLVEIIVVSLNRLSGNLELKTNVAPKIFPDAFARYSEFSRSHLLHSIVSCEKNWLAKLFQC